MLLYLPPSVGVNEPVTVAVPKLPNVMVDDARETTVVSLDENTHAPPTVEPANETEGGLTDWSASPYVAVTFVHVAALGVTRATSNDWTTFEAAR